MDTFIGNTIALGAFIPKTSFPPRAGPWLCAVAALGHRGLLRIFVLFLPVPTEGNVATLRWPRLQGLSQSLNLCHFSCPQALGGFWPRECSAVATSPILWVPQEHGAPRGSGEPEFPCRHLEPPGVHLGSCSCIPGRVDGSPGSRAPLGGLEPTGAP